MRDREMEKFERMHPDLENVVTRWREQHPSGTLEDAVRDLGLWPKRPEDGDAQWYVWRVLYDEGDPVARTGFPAMRRQAEQAR